MAPSRLTRLQRRSNQRSRLLGRQESSNMAIMIKTSQEIEKMRVSGEALRKVHDTIAPHVKAGASTMDLEEIAVARIAELGGKAAFKGYHGYPSALCTSINDEVVHGMPNAKRIL